MRDEGASQVEIDQKYANLQKALFDLREIPDKSKLEELLQQAENLDISIYTDESVEVFTVALANAQAVNADPEADQQTVNTAMETLQKAMGNLTEKETEAAADKKALQGVIAEAEKLRKEEYTEESWSMFAETLEQAKAVNEDAQAEQESVDQMTKALQNAMDELKKKSRKYRLMKGNSRKQNRILQLKTQIKISTKKM